jgi:hypothetical protein
MPKKGGQEMEKIRHRMRKEVVHNGTDEMLFRTFCWTLIHGGEKNFMMLQKEMRKRNLIPRSQ